jgi:hypothetical protein
MRCDVLTAVKTSMLVFCVVTPCGLIGRYQRFGDTYCFHLQCLLSSQYGVTTQNTITVVILH